MLEEFVILMSFVLPVKWMNGMWMWPIGFIG